MTTTQGPNKTTHPGAQFQSRPLHTKKTDQKTSTTATRAKNTTQANNSRVLST